MSENPQPRVDSEAVIGLRCRRCGHQQFRVVYTRRAPGGGVLRRRACRQCGTRITTQEREIGA